MNFPTPPPTSSFSQIVKTQNRPPSYYYDFLGRPVKYTETAESFKHSVQNTYNADNNLEALEEIINGTKYTTSYAYDDDNRLVSVTSGNTTETYAYDAYGRLISQTTKQGETTVVTETYTYTDTGETGTSSQIATLTTVAGGVTTTYTYTYDDNGNILSISDGASTTSYVYDSANQLIRENNRAGSFTHVWTYDNAGNILSRSEYAYTTGKLGTATDTVTYTYGDENWGDLLTAYDGTAITTDEIGNMLTDGTWTYSWKHGRQLASMSDGTTTWDFTYNVDGLRTKKTNGTTTYNYVYSGTTLTHLTVGNDTLHFGYGADGRPMTVTYNGTEYYYITNLQGDVVAITNSAGIEVVSYSYDAWGNPLSTTGSMASTLGIVNPLRYRGYVYDTETGLYYLQSRYYNPEIGRFICSDTLFATGQGLLGNNSFAYCLNNAVNMADYDGQDAIYVARTAGENGLVVVGHAFLFIQDSNGKWYFTHYTGNFPNKETAHVVFREAYYGEIDFYLKWYNYYDPFTNFIYIEGDFSKSVDYARELGRQNADLGGYNLLDNNCLHYTKDVLNKGTCTSKIMQDTIAKSTTIAPIDFFWELKYANDKRMLWEGVDNCAKIIGSIFKRP